MIWRQKTCQTCFPPQARCDRGVPWLSHGWPWLDRYPQLPQLGMPPPPPARLGPARPANPEAKAKVRELEGSPGIVSRQLVQSVSYQLSSYGSHCLPS